jgi:hypothetical protein
MAVLAVLLVWAATLSLSEIPGSSNDVVLVSNPLLSPSHL